MWCNLQALLFRFLLSIGYGAEEEEMRSSEPLMYDLSTLQAATDNFSEENKLGPGRRVWASLQSKLNPGARKLVHNNGLSHNKTQNV